MITDGLQTRPAMHEPNSPPSYDLTTQSTILAAKTLPTASARTPMQTVTDNLYPTELNEDEAVWRDRYSFFLERGLVLRPRYRPGWTPSWIGTTKDPSYCEDAIEQLLRPVMDAKRRRDGLTVCLKLIKKRTKEVEIAQFLSSEQLIHDTRNHSVPIFDTFSDPISPEIDYIVMPVLRPFDKPDFWAVGEVVDFVTQILEGVDFMHSHLVSHGDLTGLNIMMDGRPIFPQGWHFVSNLYSPDGQDYLTPLARIDHPVRYYIVDFGCAERFLPGQSPIIKGLGGLDGDPPEIAKLRPYDAFKLDVFTTGNVFLKNFLLKYLGVEFLAPLVNYMMIQDYQQRPTANMVLRRWYSMRAELNVDMARWRLRKHNESVSERVVLNTVAAARQGIHNLKVLFSEEPRNWTNP